VSWRPTIAQSSSTESVIVKVSDSGVPSLNAIQSFDVTVIEPVPPLFDSPSLSNGTFSLNIGGDAGPDYSVYGSTNLQSWDLLLSTNPSVLPFLFTDPAATNFNQRFYRVLLGP
jgi:hypothetical protein